VSGIVLTASLHAERAEKVEAAGDSTTARGFIPQGIWAAVTLKRLLLSG
jgi:hypothetical protein